MAPKREKKPTNTVITREHTIHLHRRVHKVWVPLLIFWTKTDPWVRSASLGNCFFRKGRYLKWVVVVNLTGACSYFRSFKKKAPRAIDVIRKFAADNMKTQDVRIDAKLNQFIWATGIR